MTSPGGNIRIPINEKRDEKPGRSRNTSTRYHGEGIQHIALFSTTCYATVDALRAGRRQAPRHRRHLLRGGSTSACPATARTSPRCKKRKILIDGNAGRRLLLQIFSENQLGPIFFEFIQRKGDQGFGEGNFKALFESIELDQMRRGVVTKN